MKAAAGLLFARGCMSLCALVSFILVGRHLSPQEFGVFALASSASLLPHLLVGAGFYEYVLGRDPDGQMTGTAATCAALSGGAAGVLLLLFAMLAWFQFGSRDAAAILVGFAVAAVLWGLVVIQEAVLVREGRGGAVAAVLSAGEIVGLAALALSFWAGAGILALAIYRLAGSLTTTLGYLLSARPGLRFRFDAAAAREMAGFSLGLMGGKVVDWVNGYGSDLLIGTFMPVAGVGVFRMGARMYLAGFAVIAQAPSAAVLSHLGRAAAASSARLRRATLQALTAAARPGHARLRRCSGAVAAIPAGIAWRGMAGQRHRAGHLLPLRARVDRLDDGGRRAAGPGAFGQAVQVPVGDDAATGCGDGCGLSRRARSGRRSEGRLCNPLCAGSGRFRWCASPRRGQGNSC